MLKPSFQTLEGQAAAVLLGAGLVFLYFTITGNSHFDPSHVINQVDLILKNPQINSIAGVSAYQQAVTVSDTFDLGKIGAILLFVYKVWSKFSEYRTDLKKKDVELQVQTKVNDLVNCVHQSATPLVVPTTQTTAPIKHKWPPLPIKNKK